jgi:hypothetical protein
MAYSRVFTPLIGWHCKCRPNTEGASRGLSVLPNIPAETTKLDFQDNEAITVLDPTSFTLLTKVAKLFVGSVSITTVADGIFTGMAALETLTLSSTPMLTLGSDSLKGLETSLTALSFAHNNAFTHMEPRALSWLRALITLDFFSEPAIEFVSGDLGEMQALLVVQVNNCAAMRRIPPRLFVGSTALTEITFEMNFNLTEIEPWAFKGCSSVQQLHLVELRSLTVLQDDALAGLSGLLTLMISSDVGGLETLTKLSLAYGARIV